MNINVVCLVIKGKEKRKLLHFLLSKSVVQLLFFRVVTQTKGICKS